MIESPVASEVRPTCGRDRPLRQLALRRTDNTADVSMHVGSGRPIRAIAEVRLIESPIVMHGDSTAVDRPERRRASAGGRTGRDVVAPPLELRDFTITHLSDAR